MLITFFIIIQALFALFILFLLISFVTGAPFVPSQTRTAVQMITMAHLKKGMKIYDLGSGEGRLLELAAAYGAKAVGFEINPFLVLYTKCKFIFSRNRQNLAVHWSNFWKAKFGDADVIFIYLIPWRMEQFETFIKKEVKPGTLVVSNSFVFPHLKLLRSDPAAHVYVFEV